LQFAQKPVYARTHRACYILALTPWLTVLQSSPAQQVSEDNCLDDYIVTVEKEALKK